VKLRFLQPAERELGEAVEYYEAQEPGLGFELFEEVWAAIERIEQYPEAWQPVSPRTRRCQTNRFPYGVIYLDFGIFGPLARQGISVTWMYNSVIAACRTLTTTCSYFF